jgi:hypothetical protein
MSLLLLMLLHSFFSPVIVDNIQPVLDCVTDEKTLTKNLAAVNYAPYNPLNNSKSFLLRVVGLSLL